MDSASARRPIGSDSVRMSQSEVVTTRLPLIGALVAEVGPEERRVLTHVHDGVQDLAEHGDEGEHAVVLRRQVPAVDGNEQKSDDTVPDIAEAVDEDMARRAA